MSGIVHGWWQRLSLAAVAVTLLAMLGLGARDVRAGRHVTSITLNAADMQALIFVWASGTPVVQQLAATTCVQEAISPLHCAAISAAVRVAWLALIDGDPAAVGRLGVAPHLAVRAGILAALTRRLVTLTHDDVGGMLAATRVHYAEIRDPRWSVGAHRVFGRPIAFPIVPQATLVTVWATAYAQTTLPPGMATNTSLYAALPDVYLKFANLGALNAIPAIDQPYYAPNGSATHWSVAITLPGAQHAISNVPITDVGPWNEDDNWWDRNGTSVTPAANCPIATPLPAVDALSNALVDGICPDGHNLRRLYYYLLYRHGGLPFFTAASAAPSGDFADGTAWPLALPQYCAETVVAASNDDGQRCVGFAAPMLHGYNANHGAWLRDGSNDAPILNQSSIDLSPAVDAALGWIYPSSGLVQVNVAGLP